MNYFLNQLKAEINFKIMHSASKILDSKSDVDIIVLEANDNTLIEKIKILCLKKNYVLVSYYSGIIENLIFNIIDLNELKSYRLDFYFEAYLSSYVSYPYAFKSIDKRFFFKDDESNININPSTEIEFAHYLLRKNIKNNLNSIIIEKLTKLYENSNKILLKEILNTILDDDLTNKVMNGDFYINKSNKLEKLLIKKKHFIKLSLAKRILNFLKNFNLKRGIHVAIIGPDGTGKTTLIEGIKEFVEPIYTEFKYIHLRPTFVPATIQIKKKINSSTKTTIPKPHANKEYNYLKDLLKTFTIYIDYFIGYQFNINPYKRKNFFICSDRYFYDMLVDPKRFRVKSLSKLTKFIFRKTLQKPDITLLLQADAETVFKRKKDLTFEEIKRQNSEYENLKKDFKEIKVINSQESIKEVLKNSLISIFNRK